MNHEMLVKIVMGLMEENVWRQKFQAGLDVKEKRRLMMEENLAKRMLLQTSHGRLGDADAYTTQQSSQENFSNV